MVLDLETDSFFRKIVFEFVPKFFKSRFFKIKNSLIVYVCLNLFLSVKLKNMKQSVSEYSFGCIRHIYVS